MAIVPIGTRPTADARPTDKPASSTARGRSPRMRQSSQQLGTRQVRAPTGALRRAGVGAVRRQRRPDANIARHSRLRSAAPDGADPVGGHWGIIHGERPQQLNDNQDHPIQRRTLSASRRLEAPMGNGVTSVPATIRARRHTRQAAPPLGCCVHAGRQENGAVRAEDSGCRRMP